MDFNFDTNVTRDQMVNALSNGIEQAPYVLANFAKTVSPGTNDFDDFIDQLDTLDDSEKKAFVQFFEIAVQSLPLSMTSETAPKRPTKQDTH